MRNTVTILFWHRLSKMNSRGKAPINYRVTRNVVRIAEFSTGIFCSPEEWDAPSQKFSNETYNIQINQIENRIRTMSQLCDARETTLTSQLIKRAVSGSMEIQSIRMSALLEEFRVKKYNMIEKMKLSKAAKTSYKSRIDNLQNWLKDQHLDQKEPGEISDDDIDECQIYFSEGYANNYVQKHLQLLKAIFKYAISKKYLRCNPMENYRLSFVKPKKNPLTTVEKDLIFHHRFASERLQHVADLFKFQCYTGFAYIDLSNFNAQTIESNDGVKFIRVHRQKTKGEALLPLLPEAEKILDKYQYKLPPISNAKYNAYLKEVADIVGINRRLHTHVARKSFSQMMIDRGYKVEVVAKMMGHSDSRITESTYCEISLERVVLEVKEETKRLGKHAA